MKSQLKWITTNAKGMATAQIRVRQKFTKLTMARLFRLTSTIVSNAAHVLWFVRKMLSNTALVHNNSSKTFHWTSRTGRVKISQGKA
jgi:hypothetical protein